MTSKKLKEILNEYDSFSEELYLRLVKELDLESKPIEERRKDFIDSLRPYIDLYGEQMMSDFGRYWMETPVNGRKMKFEKQKGWNLSLRVKTWVNNSKKFSIVGMLKKN